MDDLMSTFFSPLGKEWCLYYFIILVFVFLFLVGSVITGIIALFNIKKLSFFTIYLITIPIITNLILYYQSRIIYSICVSSLK